MEEKKRLFSAVQPSGVPTIGNYIGAIRNFSALQDKFECIYAVADLHTLTVRQDPAELRARTLNLLALYLASGIDPNKSIVFVQSHVHEHAELTWILNTLTYPGELSRMTQFKDKSRNHADNVNMGLMDYPVLMAADILLYSAALVPVGKDQTQHLEIARDLAERFNNRYSPTFVMPEGYIPETGANIMSLQDPLHKMSKSDPNQNAFISLSDDKDTIIRKFRRAVTDCDNLIKRDPARPGITNLINVYSAFTDLTPAEVEKKFDGAGYGDFKTAVGEAVAEKIVPIDEKRKEYLANKSYLEDVMLDGRDKASRIAYKMLDKVYKKVGLYRPGKK